jgi:hypothetical protein
MCSRRGCGLTEHSHCFASYKCDLRWLEIPIWIGGILFAEVAARNVPRPSHATGLSGATYGTLQLEECILCSRNRKIGYGCRHLAITVSVPGFTFKLTLLMAGSSATARSAGRVDIQPSPEPNPANTSSKTHVHKSSRLDHERAQGTTYISAVVLVESRP